MPFDPFFTSAPKPKDEEARAECNRLRELPLEEQIELNAQIWTRIKAGERVPKGQWLFAKARAHIYNAMKRRGIRANTGRHRPAYIFSGYNTLA